MHKLLTSQWIKLRENSKCPTLGEVVSTRSDLGELKMSANHEDRRSASTLNDPPEDLVRRVADLERQVAERDAELAVSRDHQTSFHKAILDTVGNGIFVLDKNMRIVLYNEKAIENLGIDPAFLDTRPTNTEMLYYLRDQSEYPDDSDDDFAERVRQVEAWFEPGKAFSYERQRPDGRWFLNSNVPLPGGGWVRSGTDITEIKQVHEALEKQTALLNLSLEHGHNGLSVLDSNLRTVLMNKRGQEMFGVSQAFIDKRPTVIETIEHLRDKNWPNLSDDEFEAFGGELLKNFDAGRPWKRENLYRGNQWLLFASTPLPDGGWVRNISDITDFKNTQFELEVAREEAESANEAKSRFLAKMSHEIRTPLSGIASYLELLQLSSLTEDQRHLVDGTLIAANTLIELIGDILDLSKIEAGHLVIHPQDIDLRVIVDNTASLLNPRALERVNQLDVNVAPEVPPILRLDPVRLSQVLLNLIGNAIKFTENGQIQIDCRWDEPTSTVRVDVSDTGIGFDDKTTPDLFGEFVRADGSDNEAAEGTGLGLAISKQLVELMGGKIGYTAKPDEGACFSFTIPVSAFGSGTVKQAPSSRNNPLAKSASDLSVLVVDDIAMNRSIAARQLDHLGIGRVDMAENGHVALAHTKDTDYDAILVDLSMPVMNGFDFAEQFRHLEASEGSTQKTPIIAVTANAMPTEIERCFEAGMDDYLSKPVSIDRLGQALHRWILDEEVTVDDVERRAADHPGPGGNAELVNLETLQALAGTDDPTVIAALISDMADSLEDVVKTMKAAVETKDDATVRKALHALDGIAGNTGSAVLNGTNADARAALRIDAWADLSAIVETLSEFPTKVRDLCA